MAVTIKRFEDILKAELVAMRTEFASHMTTIQNICSKVDFLIGEQREHKKSDRRTHWPSRCPRAAGD